ncbi:hypothetical protein [Rhodococcus jostii]|uniref:hypothetical protein n=1 Tax=Rhodococcus jostii TaxID=132919 RepID=UPI0036639288
MTSSNDPQSAPESSDRLHALRLVLADVVRDWDSATVSCADKAAVNAAFKALRGDGEPGVNELLTEGIREVGEEVRFAVETVEEALRRVRAAEAEGGEEGMAAASSAQARPRSRYTATILLGGIEVEVTLAEADGFRSLAVTGGGLAASNCKAGESDER